MTPPKIESVPPAELRLAYEVDSICDRFESAWQNGEHPQIHEYLRGTEGVTRSTLMVELVRVDISCRLQQGDPFTLDDYRSRFPEHSTLIEELHVEFKDSDTPDFQLTELKHLELIESVGRGSFGTVWKAKDTRLDRVVAVKLLRSSYTGATDHALFMREAKSLAQLKHPLVVAIHEFGQIDKQLCLVSEFIDGRTLQEVAGEARMEPREAARICQQIAEALDHVHNKGIVHRDVKPGNILLDKNRQPHIADFGLAKNLESHTTIGGQGALMGTVAYMSPEQATGHSDLIGPQSDIYSLGVILYQLLVGDVPFKGEPQAVIQQITNGAPKPPRKICNDIPKDLEVVCLKAMARLPKDRYASAIELSQDLSRVLAHKPISARRISKLGHICRWCQRQPAQATGIAGSVTAIGVAMAALAMPAPVSDGKWEVQLETSPPGAHVVVVLKDPVTRQQASGQTTVSSGTTPVSFRLSPGVYNVTVWVDGTVRHLSVDRTVPKVGATISIGGRRENLWKLVEPGVISWPPITLPPEEVVVPMTLVPGAQNVRWTSTPIGLKGVDIAPFYVSPQLFSNGDFLAMVPRASGKVGAKDEMYIPIGQDAAKEFAEAAGGRLMTEIEYDYLRTVAVEYGIEGLGKGQREWTSENWMVYRDGEWQLPELPPTPGRVSLEAAMFGVARGDFRDLVPIGPIPPGAGINGDRAILFRHHEQPGVGFRVVRSVTPETPDKAGLLKSEP